MIYSTLIKILVIRDLKRNRMRENEDIAKIFTSQVTPSSLECCNLVFKATQFSLLLAPNGSEGVTTSYS